MARWSTHVNEDELPEAFDALLSRIHGRLTDRQLWDLQVHIEYDALKPAFELLCSMLREARGPRPLLPPETLALLEDLGRALGADEAQWRDLT
jgi:hypothetical protein